MVIRQKKNQGYIVLILTTAVDKPFLDKDWVFGLKIDGYRAASEITSHSILFYSRKKETPKPVKSVIKK